MSFSQTFSSVAVVTSLSFVISYGLVTGGPVVMVWGWIVSSIFTILIGLSMGEICSVYPAAGSVYYWAGALSSKEWAPVNSYITGWFNLLGNIACDSSFAYGFS
jgi:amino acid transporter